MDAIKENWTTVKEAVRREYSLSDISYHTWVEPLEFHNVVNDVVSIIIPSDQAHALNYISSKYKSFFQVTITEMFDHPYDINFIMYVKENGLDKNRIGISVSKKVGNSVVRHRITRLVRESYRLHESVFNSGLDMVIIARPAAASIGYEEAESALLHLAKLHHLIKIYFYQD
jgi:ribonuclease P protein component